VGIDLNRLENPIRSLNKVYIFRATKLVSDVTRLSGKCHFNLSIEKVENYLSETQKVEKNS